MLFTIELNYLLADKDKADFEGKDDIIARGLFSRAHFIFELQNFSMFPYWLRKEMGSIGLETKESYLGINTLSKE